MIKIADIIEHKNEFCRILDYLNSEFNFSNENLFNTLDEKILKKTSQKHMNIEQLYMKILNFFNPLLILFQNN